MTPAFEARAYVGVGGNLGTDAALLARFAAAARAIEAWPEVGSVRRSPIYRSAPVGPVSDQPWFLDAVFELELEAAIDPVRLLGRLLALELELGRQRDGAVAKGPRAIDLDLLLVGGIQLDTAGPPPLVLPHPAIAERAFVLVPLCDLAGVALLIPGAGRLDAVLAVVQQAGDVGLVPVDDHQGDGDAQGDVGVRTAEQKE